MLSFGNMGSAMDNAPLSFGSPVTVYDDAILRRARASGATTYRPPSNSQKRAASSPTLSFPGIAAVPDSRNTVVPLTYGSSVPSGGGVLSTVGSFLSSFSMGSPANGQVYDDAILRNARASGATTYDPRNPVNISNTPQSTVGNVDGSANWIDRIKSVSEQVQGLIGSTGDASRGQVQQVAYEQPAGPNWLLIGGVVALAGAAYYVSTR